MIYFVIHIYLNMHYGHYFPRHPLISIFNRKKHGLIDFYLKPLMENARRNRNIIPAVRIKGKKQAHQGRSGEQGEPG